MQAVLQGSQGLPARPDHGQGPAPAAVGVRSCQVFAVSHSLPIQAVAQSCKGSQESVGLTTEI